MCTDPLHPVYDNNAVALRHSLQTGKIDKDDALRLAAQSGYVELVNILLDNGADLNYNDGLSMELAVMCGRFEVVKTLVDRGASYKGMLSVAISNGHTNIAQFFSELMPNDEVEYPSLILAIRHGHVSTIEFAERTLNINMCQVYNDAQRFGHIQERSVQLFS